MTGLALSIPSSFGPVPSVAPLVTRKRDTEGPEKSFGEFPAPRPVDPMAFYRCFRDKWPDFIRRNFRNSTDAAAFFGVDDRTVRGWIEGSTAPRGQVVAYAVAAMPSRAMQIVGAAA